jgi:SAM-dependent methyltransferase
MNSKNTVLGASPFNYSDYTVWLFIHYYQQVHHLMALKPKRVLEIGPGDHAITDFLRRKGVYVKTFDNASALHPDYAGDVRKPFGIKEKFDLVLASEVLEHNKFRHLPQVLENIKQVLEPGGRLVISLPYSTVRLFPSRSNYGKIVSCEGRIYTYIPCFITRQLLPCLSPLSLLRAAYRLIVSKKRPLFMYPPFGPNWPDDKFDIHHWDLGYWPTSRSVVRKILQQHYLLCKEKAYINTNVVFYILVNNQTVSL